jgi:hypothetical protein
MTRARPAGGFRITSRDREIVRWIGRLRMVTATQISERFAVGRAVGYARLGGLVKLGLLEHARIFHATPGVYMATRAGLAAVDLALPPARVDVRTYDHDLELSSLVIDLEREFGCDRLSTEREMRTSDTPLGGPPIERPRFAVPLTGARGQLQLTPVGHPRLHFPDCAVAGDRPDDPMIAVELERTAKSRARLRGILSAYITARHVGRVRYCIPNGRVHDLVSSEVARLRAGDLVDVRPLNGALERTRGVA